MMPMGGVYFWSRERGLLRAGSALKVSRALYSSALSDPSAEDRQEAGLVDQERGFTLDYIKISYFEVRSLERESAMCAAAPASKGRWVWLCVFALN